MGYTTSGIRNIALVGPASAGKTSLAEALLCKAGRDPRAAAASSAAPPSRDFDPLEKRAAAFARRRAHAPSTATACTCIRRSTRPGYPDFLGQALPALEAVETAAVVISAADRRRDDDAARMMEWAQRARAVPPDHRQQDRRARTSNLRRACSRRSSERFGTRMPAAQPARRRRRRAWSTASSQPHGAPTDFSSRRGRAHADHRPGGRGRREADGAYLEQGDESRPSSCTTPLEQALREGHLVPVCFVSRARPAPASPSCST